jgi:hypothetical protein
MEAYVWEIAAGGDNLDLNTVTPVMDLLRGLQRGGRRDLYRKLRTVEQYYANFGAKGTQGLTYRLDTLLRS